MGYVYKITNIVNGKSYIGVSIHDPEYHRIRKHLIGHGSQELAKDINKYRCDVFTYEILEEGVFPELLPDLEKAYIAKIGTFAPNGYNLTRGGGGTSGLSHSEKSRKKMSDSHQGKKLSDEHRKNISTALKDKKPSNFETLHSKESREKSGLARRGRSRPKEVGDKIGIAHRTPHYDDMYKFYLSLPSDMDAPEKRDALHEKFFNIVPRSLINRWFRRWYEESIQSGVVKLSEKTLRKLKHPQLGDDYEDAYIFFLSLPANMSIKEKRHLLHKEFPATKKGTMNRRIRKWQPECHMTRGRSPYRIPAREMFFSLSNSLTFKEKRKILLEKFSDVVSYRSLYNWVCEWQSELKSKT